MKVAFRVDASSMIGTGHVARCLTLASALREAGADVHFVCRSHIGHLFDRIEEANFALTRLPAGIEQGAGYASWLGAGEDIDAAESSAALEADGGYDWIVVDHYGIGATWEAIVGEKARRLMVIDDLADRAHLCHLLLDPNLTRQTSTRYRGLVPEECAVLAGPQYALLGQEYAQCTQHRTRSGKIAKLVVFFGGADHQNLTAQALAALSRPAFADIEVNVVLGASNPHAGEVRALAARRPNTNVISGAPSLVAIWSDADLAVASSGVSTWERICCRLPAVIVTSGVNQREPIALAAEAGCVLDLGDAEMVSVEGIADAIATLIADEARVRSMSERCAGLIDGFGTLRVVEAMSK